MFKDETLKNIETTLKRADLVKFAKSKPQFEIMRMDKQIIAQEIDQVRAGLPKPSEIELQQTLEYQKGLKKRKKQQGEEKTRNQRVSLWRNGTNFNKI